MGMQTGQIIDGKYRIIREIGHGSMGAVYEGENILIHRRVAIKVLHPAIAAHGNTIQRFEREAQAAGRIGSDHIVEVLDLGSLRDGSYYMVMEFLEGITLTKRIRSKGRLGPREVVPVCQQLLTGLEAAHHAGIIHRDLKPDNVFLQESRAGQADFVKILDFGVSKFNPLNAEENMDLTRAGSVVGTPFYMSPEQAKGSREIDARSDIYSVGVILFEAITGQVPFHAGTFNELIFKIVLETPPPPEHFVPDLDPAFSRIIRKAMSRDPSDRYSDAAEMRDALSVWLHTGNDVLPAARPGVGMPPPPPVRGRAAPPPPPRQRATVPMPLLDVEDVDENAQTRIVSAPPAPRPAPQDDNVKTRIVSGPPPEVPRLPPPPPLPVFAPTREMPTTPPAKRDTVVPGGGPGGHRAGASRRSLLGLGAVVAAVIALTAGGIAAVVLASPGSSASNGTPTTAASTAAPTASATALASATASAQPSASALASTSATETAAAATATAMAVADSRPPTTPADAPRPSAGRRKPATTADPPATTSPPAPTDTPAPSAAGSSTAKTKGKKGRPIQTEL